MTKPDSLLNGCKAVSELAGVPWAKGQMIYRALQKDGPAEAWLPTSRGRAIWVADRIFVARFLIVLATTSHPDDAAFNALRFSLYTEDGLGETWTGPGVGFNPVPLDQALAALMWSGIDHPSVTFRFEGRESRVELIGADGESRVFKNGPRDWLPSEYAFVEPDDRGLIHRTVTIDPEFFERLATRVNLSSNQPPTRAADDAEAALEFGASIPLNPDRPS
jgi:hypothetical protein